MRVACWLLAKGHSDRLLIKAALLHDVGKAGGGVTVFHRVIWVLMGRFTPGWRRKVITRGGPWQVLADHAVIGASRLRTARSDPRVIALVSGRGLIGDEARTRLLAQADDSV